MSNHTPEPWQARPRDSASTGKAVGGWSVFQENTRDLPTTIAYLQSHPMLTFERMEANARLVTAAPIGSRLAHKILETATIETPQVLIDLANEFIAKADSA